MATLLLAEIIRVYLLDHIRVFSRNPNIMIHHHLTQLFTVNQNNLLSNSRDVVLGVGRKMRGCTAYICVVVLASPSLNISRSGSMIV